MAAFILVFISRADLEFRVLQFASALKSWLTLSFALLPYGPGATSSIAPLNCSSPQG
jgi:hypothetical protein